jgi:UDP-N-acetylglucosamine transferase subunit ALG13
LPQTEAINVQIEDRPMLIASTGGHLEQLYLWAQRWKLLGQGAVWITFDNEQSRSLLAGENVRYIPYVAPRDWKGAVSATRLISSFVSECQPNTLVSTGSAVGVSMALVGLGRRRRTIYIESLARSTGLSLSGRLISRLPRIEKYVQNPALAVNGFKYGGSILDSFKVIAKDKEVATPLKVFVSLGTIQPYKFDRMIDSMSELLKESEVTWQIGKTSKEPIFGTVHRLMSKECMAEIIQESDVVITHAGVGSILSALSLGKMPIVVPRLSQFNEHVDDHQLEIASELSNRGLIIYRENTGPSLDDLVLASKSIVVPDEDM